MTDTRQRSNRLRPGRTARQMRPRMLRYAHIVGWGKEVPTRILSNHDLEAIVDTNDDWIMARTGIKERRIAEQHETTTSLATRAAQKALDVADVLPSEIDLIIVATATPEHMFPSTASLVQDLLGATNAGAFDLSAACSGFVYALDMAASKIQTGTLNTVVVIGAETLSRVIDWSDRGTCILFGDGAGAVVLQGSDIPGGILSSILRSDGSGWDLLTLPTASSRDTYLQDGNHQMHRIYMDGRGVYRFASRVIGDSIKDALHQVGLQPDDLDLVIPHQANQRIIEHAAKSLKIPGDRVYSNIAHYGNTSAATIPIALAEALAEGRVSAGDTLAFVGFGGGLSWASIVIEWTAASTKSPYSITWGRRQGEYALAGLRRPVRRWWRRLMLLSPTTWIIAWRKYLKQRRADIQTRAEDIQHRAQQIIDREEKRALPPREEKRPENQPAESKTEPVQETTSEHT